MALESRRKALRFARAGLTTWGEWAAVSAAVVLAYGALGWLGFQLASGPENVTLVWPPAGVAVAVLYLFGYRVLPAIVVGNLALQALYATPVPTMAGMSAAAIAGPCLAALGLRGLGAREELFANAYNAVRALGLLGLIGAGVAAATGTGWLALWKGLPLAEIVATLRTWWIGDAVGALVAAPLILAWSTAGERAMLGRAPWEFAALTGVTLVTSFGTYWFGVSETEYLTVPPLIWAALRFRMIGATSMVTLVAASAVSAELLAPEPYFRDVVSIQTLIGLLACTVIILAAKVASETEARQSADLQRALARTDPLTGLLNKAGFDEAFRQALSHARRRSHKLAVCFIDLNGFKAVNDSYGHDAGDQLLQAVADRLRRSLRMEDLKARVGGDEFLVVQPDVVDAAAAAAAAERLLAAIRQPCDLNGVTVLPSAAVGVALYPDDDSAAERLLKKADEAMYDAKSTGAARYSLFNPSCSVGAG